LILSKIRSANCSLFLIDRKIYKYPSEWALDYLYGDICKLG